jgi:DnaJ-class molecular chaperone
MMWILLVLLLLGAAVACTVAVRAFRRGAGQDFASRPGRVRCLRCRGTGWLGGETERTFTFTGDGFEDRHNPATPCPDCRGTGLTTAPRPGG